MKILTIAEAAFLADKVERKFDYAAKAWVNGNNSGDSVKLAAGEARCDKLRREAEAMLEPYGITVDYPGLYPSFLVNGGTEYTVLAALSRACQEVTS